MNSFERLVYRYATNPALIALALAVVVLSVIAFGPHPWRWLIDNAIDPIIRFIESTKVLT